MIIHIERSNISERSIERSNISERSGQKKYVMYILGENAIN